jgi:hypothetical protein
MSLISVYLLAKTVVFRNEQYIQVVFKIKSSCIKIRALERGVMLIFMNKRMNITVKGGTHRGR